MTYLGPALRRRRRRTWRGWRHVAGVALSLAANLLILGLIGVVWTGIRAPRETVRPVGMAPVSTQRWEANRKVTDGSRPAPPRPALAKAARPAAPARSAPETPAPQAPPPTAQPMARQQVVDVAPGNDRVPNDARLLAESNNSVEKETVSRFAKAGAEHTTPRPTQNTQKAQAPLEPPRTLARPEVPSERAGGDSRKAGAPGAPAPQEQTPPRRADGERVAALFSPDGLLRSRPVVPPPPAPASQQPPGQGGEGGQGASALPGGRPILEPSPAFFDQLSGNAFPDHVTGADVGDSTFLNTREWKYAGYFNRIKQSVAEHWNPNGALRARDPSGARFGSGEHVTVLTVTLGSDGRVKDIRVTRSSGLGFLDQSAIDAFASAQPFLHPPPGLADPQGEIRFPFGFHVAPQAGGFPFFGTPR